MWALLLPLPWFLVGLFAGGLRRRGKPGCLFIGGVFVWPQAALLEGLGIGPALAWGLSLGIMVLCPVLGYLLGLRLFPPDDKGEPPQT
jgi:hypothetical protein